MGNQFKEIMSEEIKKRLDSKNWNYSIASSVLEKKNQTKKRFIYATSLSSLAVAASILIFFIFGINRPETNLYNQFISNQLRGTYNEVYKKESKTTAQYEQFINNQLTGTHNEVFDKEYKLTSAGIRGEDIILMNGTDALIDSTLTIR
jgi:hypothetical protein